MGEQGPAIVAVADENEAGREKVAKSLGAKNAYADYRQMLEKEKPQIVIVATPDHAHAVIAMAAMQLGKHVYVQKPLTRTVSEARALTEAARKYIVESLGFDQSRVGYITYGHEKMYLTDLDVERLAEKKMSSTEANRSALVFTYPCYVK